jgi:hypothetical protein
MQVKLQAVVEASRARLPVAHVEESLWPCAAAASDRVSTGLIIRRSEVRLLHGPHRETRS